MPAGRWRLFVAIDLPEEVRSALAAAQEDLNALLRTAHVRWTPRDQLHLTLVFLGGVAADRVPALADALRAACAPHGALHLVARAVGSFPPHRPPRVLWAGIDDPSAGLPALQRDVEAAARAFAGEPTGARFSAHVTLGRVKDLAQDAPVFRQLPPALRNRPFGDWTATAVSLFRSELGTGGATHEALATLALGRPVAGR